MADSPLLLQSSCVRRTASRRTDTPAKRSREARDSSSTGTVTAAAAANIDDSPSCSSSTRNKVAATMPSLTIGGGVLLSPSAQSLDANSLGLVFACLGSRSDKLGRMGQRVTDCDDLVAAARTCKHWLAVATSPSSPSAKLFMRLSVFVNFGEQLTMEGAEGALWPSRPFFLSKHVDALTLNLGSKCIPSAQSLLGLVTSFDRLRSLILCDVDGEIDLAPLLNCPQLTSLERLSPMSEAQRGVIRQLKTLRILNLGHFDKAGAMDELLVEPHSLHSLHTVLGGRINDADMLALATLPQLTSLRPEELMVGVESDDDNDYDDGIYEQDAPSLLQELKHLLDLRVGVSGANCTPMVEKCPALTSLRIDALDHDDETMREQLEMLPNLTQLHLFLAVEDNLAPLAAASKLAILTLEDTSVTLENLKQLTAVPSLRHLNLLQLRQSGFRSERTVTDEELKLLQPPSAILPQLLSLVVTRA